jgi:outer membrane receptor protein involved in Fe transport
VSTPKILVDNLRQANSCAQQRLLHDGQRVLNVDAGVFAQIDATWKAQLNIENIFNKGASADGNNNVSPGQPRTFRFKVTAKL